nr:uncharacterized protein LOC111511926 [Leptinotarsa decemlineata]XP_023023769.1 uncharacterized protein LOC111511926 [Leptinotarsa decemlineata]
MGGCRCSYRNCQNTTKTTDNIHFFHYPVKHKERCKIWIENAQKPQFCDLEEDQLRNKVICEIHFEDKWFPNSQKKRLLQSAIPTLGCDDEPEEAPMFISSHLQDIQVLPASSDGTLFVLDTDNMFSRSQKVESYIYKNGMIVPSSSVPKPEIKQEQLVAKPSTSRASSSLRENYNMKLRGDIPMEGSPRCSLPIKKELPDFNESSNRVHRNGIQRIQVEEEYDTQNQEQLTGMSELQKKTGHRPSMRNLVMKNVVEKPTLGRNYLRKIKQHSRDIATIKKMLRQKTLSESKVDNSTILNSLKDQLPPSFFTILTLNLNSKCDLSEEDVDFFATIHKTSPEVYQLLMDKYKWNLPCVDIVETVE